MSRPILTAISAATFVALLPFPSDHARAQSGAVLEEVIVTAQRREASLERTPISVDVLGTQALEEQAITSELDLQTALPGLTVKASQSANQLNYSLRGQTVDAFSFSRPSVLPYFNEVQVGGSSSTAFYDLASVQVLKGPQGTLFGRNSTGGAVLFTTAKPTNEFGGYIKGWVGNYDATKIEGAVNIPLIDDKLLMRLATYYQTREGYQKNLADDSRLGDVRRKNIRLSLTYKPTENLTNDFVLDYARSDGDNLTSVAYNTLGIANATDAFVPTPLLYSPLMDQVFGFDGAWDAFLAAHPKADPEGWVASVEKQQQRDAYTVNVDAPNFHMSENFVVSNITTFDLANGMQIRNILGYTHLRNNNGSEFDGTPFPSDDNGTEGRGGTLEQFSEEIQLQGTVWNDQLEFVTGLYFSDEEDHIFSLSVLFDFLPIAPPVRQINHAVISNETYAIYGQGTLDLSDIVGIEGLGATLGARYSNEEVTMDRKADDFFITSPVPEGATYLNPLEDTFEQVSWTAGLQQQVNPDLLLYLVSRRSFRSGGFNFFAPPLPGFGNEGGAEYMEEEAVDVELGAKFNGVVADMPVRVNLALYKMWIDEVQRSNYVQIFGSLAGITVNVPEAQIEGAELDIQIKPTSWLTLGGAVNYTDAEFTENLVSVLGNPTVAFGPYPDTPEWASSVFGQVTVPVGERLDLSFRADVYHQTETYFSSTGNTLNPGTELPEYTTADFRVALENAEAGWTVAAYLKNAFDEEYYVGGIGFKSLFAVNTVIPGTPRTYMAEISYRF